MSEKLKSFLLNDHIFFGFIIIMVGVGSFSLGRASVSEVKAPDKAFGEVESFAPIVTTSFKQGSQKTAAAASVAIEEIVASKSGTKYHLASCAGAKQIKPENIITFKSRAEAEAAGYKPAANCPELQ